jgi:hypothetical protein
MRHNLLALGLLSVCVGFLGPFGCADNQIGRPCNDLNKVPASGVNFVNPAPDCPTRLCMVSPTLSPQQKTRTGSTRTGALAMCTAFCESNSDCQASDQYTKTDRCKKYVCAIPSVVPGEENFCCRKLCVCEDDLIPGLNTNDERNPGGLMKEGDVVIPTACTASRIERTCKL